MLKPQCPQIQLLSSRLICKKHTLLAGVFTFMFIGFFSLKPNAPVSKAIMSQTLVNKSHTIIHKYASNQQGLPLLLLFTTFHPSLSKSHIFENTLRNWALLRPAVQPLMFYDKDMKPQWKQLLREYGWAMLPIPKYNSFDLPVLRFMFETAIDSFPAHHYGFSNGDVLFDESLVLTLEALYQHPVIEDFLLVGRRINYYLKKGEILHSLAEIRLYSQRNEAKIFIKEAEDYFITTKHAFTWDDFPNFVVGRVGYDNYIVGYAIQKGPLVVDATNTVLCLHQTGEDGDYSGSKAKTKPNFNLELAGKKFDYSLGTTDCAQWITVFSEELKTVVIKKRSAKYCYGHSYTHFEHQDAGIAND